MDVNIFIKAAQQFLTTPQGQKFLESLKIDDIDKVTDAIKLVQKQEFLQKKEEITSEITQGVEVVVPKLTREERKKLRKEKRKSRNERISEEYDKAKAKGKELAGQEASKYLPYIQKFTIKGQVYDQFTNDPIRGIEVHPQLCIFPVSTDPKIYADARELTAYNTVYRQNPITFEPLVDKEGNYRFQGVFDGEDGNEDGERDPLNKDIKFNELGLGYVLTDEEGKFEVTVGLPVLDIQPTRILNPSPDAPPFIAYIDKDDRPQTITDIEEVNNNEFSGSTYAPSVQPIITWNGEVPEELNIHALYNIEKAVEQEVAKQVEQVNQFVIEKVDPILSIPETAINKLRKFILKPASVVQQKLLPLAFELMTYFKIAKEEQANQLQSQCPSNERLADIIRKRNSIVKQINNIYIIITANVALAFLFEYLSRFLNVLKKIIEDLNFPTSVPPGVGIPFSIISKLESLKDAFEKLGDVNKELKKQLIIALIFLIIALIIILRYLKTLDKLIEGCESTDNLVEINKELLALGIQNEEDGGPQVKIVNGFEMFVEVVDKAQVGELPRRQAVAKNSKGITILKGEPSFSAEDQILIDELAFYIQVNNLKAD